MLSVIFDRIFINDPFCQIIQLTEDHHVTPDYFFSNNLQDDDEVALDYTAPPDQPSQTFSFHTH